VTKAAFKRSRRTQKAAAARKRGSKQAVKRTRKATRARKTAPRATRKLATRPKPPALERERRTLTEEPGMPPAMAPETKASSPEPRAGGESGASEAGATSTDKEERFD
jgi:hypothetical protein